MIGLNTDILVRYLIQDDKEQAALANNIINKYATKAQSIFINNIVICELVWILTKGYQYEKEQIVTVLRNIILTVEFAFEHQKILREALSEYEKTDLDFSDALISKLNQKYNCDKTFTFDLNCQSSFKLVNNFV